MPAMTPEDLHRFLEEHFPQAAHLDLRIEQGTWLGLGLAAHEHRATHHQRARALAARDEAAIDEQLVEAFARHASL